MHALDNKREESHNKSQKYHSSTLSEEQKSDKPTSHRMKWILLKNWQKVKTHQQASICLGQGRPLKVRPLKSYKLKEYNSTRGRQFDCVSLFSAIHLSCFYLNQKHDPFAALVGTA